MSDRAPFAGDRRRERAELDITGLPLQGRVIVTPVRLDGRTSFEVWISWHGPPAPGSGLPAVPGGVAGSATHYLPALGAALEVGQRAAAELRESRVPDLGAIAAGVRNSDR